MANYKAAIVITLISSLGIIAPAVAYEEGDWVVRAGITNVYPDDSSGNVFVDGTDLGTGVSVDDDFQLGLNFAYFLTDNWSLELLAATPFEHDIDLDGVGPLASIEHLPPSLTANYHFRIPNSQFQPYVGAGINYTLFFEEEFTDANKDAGFSDLDLDNSFGLTAQVGADFHVNETWHINASVRWIDIDTDATFDLSGSEGKVDVEIDPFVYTLSVGYRF